MLGEKKKGWYPDHLSLHHIPPQTANSAMWPGYPVSGRMHRSRKATTKQSISALELQTSHFFFRNRREGAIQTGEVVLNLNETPVFTTGLHHPMSNNMLWEHCFLREKSLCPLQEDVLHNNHIQNVQLFSLAFLTWQTALLFPVTPGRQGNCSLFAFPFKRIFLSLRSAGHYWSTPQTTSSSNKYARACCTPFQIQDKRQRQQLYLCLGLISLGAIHLSLLLVLPCTDSWTDPKTQHILWLGSRDGMVWPVEAVPCTGRSQQQLKQLLKLELLHPHCMTSVRALNLEQPPASHNALPGQQNDIWDWV